MTEQRTQMREAAQVRPGRVLQALQVLRRRASAPVLLVMAALAAAAVLGFVVVMLPERDDVAPADGDLRVVAHGPFVGQGGGLGAAFGAVWAGDTGTGQLLRVDPETRAVQAQLDIGSRPYVTAGAGALWAVSEGRLYRIDPAGPTVADEIRLPPGDFGGVVPGKGAMWLVNPFELRRVDPERMAIGRKVEIAHGSFMADGVAYDRDAVYVHRSDGVLTTFDAATGARVTSSQVQGGARLLEPAAGALVFASADDVGVAGVDPRTGRTRWTRDLGTSRINGAVAHGSTLWVHGSVETTGRDRLWRIDARDGRVVGSATLPDFGLDGIAPVGDALWLVSPGGQLTVVEPA